MQKKKMVRKAPTDVWDEINGDQTLLNFFFSSPTAGRQLRGETLSTDELRLCRTKNAHTYSRGTFSLCLSHLSLLGEPGRLDWEYIGSLRTCLLWCVKLIFRMSTQSQKPESTHPVCVWFLLSVAHNAIFIFAPFPQTHGLILFLASLSGSPFHSYCFKSSLSLFFFFFLSLTVFTKKKKNPQSCCKVCLRSWKVLFKPQVFAKMNINWQDEYRRDKA